MVARYKSSAIATLSAAAPLRSEQHLYAQSSRRAVESHDALREKSSMRRQPARTATSVHARPRRAYPPALRTVYPPCTH